MSLPLLPCYLLWLLFRTSVLLWLLPCCWCYSNVAPILFSSLLCCSCYSHVACMLLWLPPHLYLTVAGLGVPRAPAPSLAHADLSSCLLLGFQGKTGPSGPLCIVGTQVRRPPFGRAVMGVGGQSGAGSCLYMVSRLPPAPCW